MTTPRRILVIDDSEVMLARIKRALTSGADWFDVVTTAQAVGNARHMIDCDLVIMDFHMPGIDGGTVVASLREAAAALALHSRPRCLFYLYTSDPTIAASYARLGFDGAFTEKGNEEALVRQVRAVFRMIKMRAMSKSRPDG